MKTWTKQQIFTFSIFLILLATRVIVADPVSNLEQLYGISNPLFGVKILNAIHELTYYLLFGWCFILVGIVIIINRNDLQSLNIDNTFVAIFIASSVTYWKYYRSPLGWIALLLAVILFYSFYKKKAEFKFAKIEPIGGQITLIIVIIFFLVLLVKRVPPNINSFLFISHSIATELPFLLVEEVIFRGLLWNYLANLNWPPSAIVGMQAFLFWLAHINTMIATPVFFWVIVPIGGITLGVIVWQSKSLTVSLFAHMLFNFLLSII